MDCKDKFLSVGIINNQYEIASILIDFFKENNKMSKKEIVEKYGIRTGEILNGLQE